MAYLNKKQIIIDSQPYLLVKEYIQIYSIDKQNNIKKYIKQSIYIYMTFITRIAITTFHFIHFN